jgi:hypothetical protein
MATQIYGRSDDLIEFVGDVFGEVGCYRVARDDQGVLVVCSDGTLLDVKYGKPGNGGVWAVSLVKRGGLLDRIDQCDDPDAELYSDVAHFRDGLKWAYAATGWEPVK